MGTSLANSDTTIAVSGGPTTRTPNLRFNNSSTRGRNRTCGLSFRKPLLYPLSYAGLHQPQCVFLIFSPRPTAGNDCRYSSLSARTAATRSQVVGMSVEDRPRLPHACSADLNRRWWPKTCLEGGASSRYTIRMYMSPAVLSSATQRPGLMFDGCHAGRFALEEVPRGNPAGLDRRTQAVGQESAASMTALLTPWRRASRRSVSTSPFSMTST